MNRRQFLQSTAATAALASAPLPILAQDTRPVRIGVIGAGSRGQEDLRHFLHVPGVSVSAVCDIYPPRFEQVNRLVGATVPATRSAEELVHRADVDAVLIASPVACHLQHSLAASRAGKPIFGEKSFGFTVSDCQALHRELTRSKVLYQVGHEYRYAAWIQEAVRRIHSGEIGDVTHVYAYWHRNGNWRRPVPSPDLEHLINWRLYRNTSGGLVTELGSHHVDLANWIFREPQPTATLGTTSIVRYHDGRTVGDNVQAIFHYSAGRRLVFSSLTDNAKVGNEVWVYGTRGSVQLTIEDATFFYEEGNTNTPTAANHTIVQRGVETGASYSTKGEMPYRGPGAKVQTPNAEDPTLASCRAFIHSVRTGQPPVADYRVGYGSGIACAVAMDAVFTELKTPIPPPSA